MGIKKTFNLLGEVIGSTSNAEEINPSSTDIQSNREKNTMRSLGEGLLDDFLVSIFESAERMEATRQWVASKGLRWDLESLKSGILERVSMRKLMTVLIELSSYNQEEQKTLREQLDNPVSLCDFCQYFSDKRNEIVLSKNRHKNQKKKPIVPEIENVKESVPTAVQLALKFKD